MSEPTNQALRAIDLAVDATKIERYEKTSTCTPINKRKTEMSEPANEVALRSSAISQLRPDQLLLLKMMIAPNHTDMELQLFMEFCRAKSLDPFSREVYSVKRQGKVSFQMGIDGLRGRAGNGLDGQDVRWCGADGAWTEAWLDTNPPAAAKVTIYRRGCSHGFEAVALWREYKVDGEQGFMWKKMPANQLAKCAESLALRKAFPKECGNIYCNDEMAQEGSREDGRLAAQEVAGRKIVEHEKSFGGPADIDQVEGTIADLSDDPLPGDPEPKERKTAASHATTSDFVFLAECRRFKDAMPESSYYGLMPVPAKKSNQITNSDDKALFLERLKRFKMVWAAGGRLYENSFCGPRLADRVYRAAGKVAHDSKRRISDYGAIDYAVQNSYDNGPGDMNEIVVEMERSANLDAGGAA